MYPDTKIKTSKILSKVSFISFPVFALCAAFLYMEETFAENHLNSFWYNLQYDSSFGHIILGIFWAIMGIAFFTSFIASLMSLIFKWKKNTTSKLILLIDILIILFVVGFMLYAIALAKALPDARSGY